MATVGVQGQPFPPLQSKYQVRSLPGPSNYEIVKRSERAELMLCPPTSSNACKPLHFIYTLELSQLQLLKHYKTFYVCQQKVVQKYFSADLLKSIKASSAFPWFVKLL